MGTNSGFTVNRQYELAAPVERESDIPVVRAFDEALDRGDVARILSLLDPQIEWVVPTSLPYGGVFRGHEGFREFLAKLIQQPLEFRRGLREYLDAGDRVVVPLRFFARRKGSQREFEVSEVHIWTVLRGKIEAFVEYMETAMVILTAALCEG